MKPRSIPLLLALALASPASALASDPSGGTAVPRSGNGGVRSIPSESPKPAAARPRQPAPVAAARARGPAESPAQAVPSQSARQSQAEPGGTVEVPVPKAVAVASRHAPARHTVAATSGQLATTGLDLGGVVAAAMLMIGAGLFISAMVGPRPRRAS